MRICNICNHKNEEAECDLDGTPCVFAPAPCYFFELVEMNEYTREYYENVYEEELSWVNEETGEIMY